MDIDLQKPELIEIIAQKIARANDARWDTHTPAQKDWWRKKAKEIIFEVEEWICD